MNSVSIFWLQILVSLGVFSLVVIWYVWSQLIKLSRSSALTPLLWVQVFRYVGMALLVKGMVDPRLPHGFLSSAAYGDLIAAALSLASIFALRSNWRGAIPLVWVANMWGFFDTMRLREKSMREDIVPGATFPDYELPDQESVSRRLSEIQGDDPLILTLARGNFCPKEHLQHLELAALYPKIAVAYTKIATISTDDHHTSQEFRLSVGAQWPVPVRPRADRAAGPWHQGVHRPRQRPDDPAHAGAQARPGRAQHLQRLLVLGPAVGQRPVA